MIVHIKRIDDAFKMEASNETGEKLYMDASRSLGASESAFRPMQTLLASLAGCTGIDVLQILKKQRQRLDDFQIKVTATRKDGTPSPFESINLHFILKGKIKAEKIEKALELSHSKYCSVYFSLHPDIDISNTYELEYVD